ncbi:MAG: heme exporter protein CcmB [Azospirillaceae bacterium]
MSGFFLLLRREIVLALRGGTDAGVALAFFVIAVTLFPFGLGPEPNLLARIAPGVLWVAALLAALLSLERLFQGDADDGVIEVHLARGTGLEVVAFAKMVAHWLVTGLPLVLVSPVLAAMLGLPSRGYLILLATLLVGTPVLSLVGGIGAALTIGARRGGALLALLVLPLLVPPLIFAVGAIDAVLQGLSARANLLLLGGLLAAALPLAPVAAAAAMRQAVE